MITFNFNGIDFSEYLTVNDGIRGRGLANSEVVSIDMRRRTGTVFGGKKYQERVIDIPFTIKATSTEDLRDRIEEIVGLLHTEGPAPLIFSDEPDRTYYAVSAGGDDLVDVTYRHGQGTMTFICNDPIKYGEPKTADFVDGAAVIQNRGTLPAKPLFRAEVLSDITYMDVFTDTSYMRIGQPSDLETPAVEPTTILMNNPMNNLTGWTYGGTVVDGGTTANGTFVTSNGNFIASNLGTGSTWHGPAVKQSIPQAPLTDFIVEFRFSMATHADRRGRVELYLLDDLGNAIGKLAMVRKWSDKGNRVEVRIGGGSVYTFPVNYYGGPRGTEWNNFDGIIRFKREGNVTDIYVANIDPSTGAHRYPHSTRYVDTEGKYLGNLSQVQPHIGVYSNYTHVASSIKDIKVWRINDVPDTDPRIIARAGDIIEIDHKQSGIFINGESRKDLKDFGGRFFSIPKGDQAVLVEPRDALSVEAIIEEEYL